MVNLLGQIRAAGRGDKGNDQDRAAPGPIEWDAARPLPTVG
jgi:hypothetical protein